MGGPGGDAGPVQSQIANEIVGEGDCGDAMVGGLTRGGDGAGDDEILAHVTAVIDAREDQVRLNAKAKESDTHAIGGRAIHGIAVLACRCNLQGLSRGDAVTALRLLGGWSDSDDSGGRK